MHHGQSDKAQYGHVNDVNGIGIFIELVHKPVGFIETEPESVEHHVQETEHRQERRDVIHRSVHETGDKKVVPSGVDEIEEQVQGNGGKNPQSKGEHYI